MNLLVKKLWLPVLMILAAITIISCEDPGRIGLIIGADNGLLRTGYKEVILPSTVVQFDPRETTESGSFKAGGYTDQDFGKVDYRYYTQLNPSIVVEPSDNSTFDRFTLSIGFTDMTGPSPQNRRINYIAVNQLDEPIEATASYLRTDSLRVRTQLGQWEFEPYVNDTLRTDSTYVIDLADDVGRDLFLKLKDGDPIFNSPEEFNAYFNGVSFETGTDATHIFDVDLTKVKFTLHYLEVNSEGNPVEREFVLNVGSNNFHHISVDYAGTPLSGLAPDNQDFEPANGFRYMQSGTMVAIKIDLEPFRQLSDSIEYMVINKAEIIMDEIDVTSEYNQPPDDLLSYFTDDTNEWPIIDTYGRVDSSRIGEYFVALQDQSISVDPGFYGFNQLTDFNKDSSYYNINVSNFLQNLYAGNYVSATEPFVEEHGLMYIFTETSVLFPTFSVSHTETTGFKVNKDNIKLRIYYSYPTIQQTP